MATKDGYLIARHEPNIHSTTDVRFRLEFAHRKRTMRVDGVPEDGFFITYRPIISRMLPDLKLAADPPPLAPARWEPVRVAWTSA